MKFIYTLFFLLATFVLFGQNEEDTTNISPPDSLDFERDSSTNNPEIDELIKFAKNFLGTPYRYSGTTPSGFDCSGFIYYIMGNFGFQVTRTSYGLADLGRNVKLAQVKPGDLLFFKGRNSNTSRVGHVGMVVEVTELGIFFIHSSSSRGVVIDNFKASKYYIPRFIKAKRMDYGVPD